MLSNHPALAVVALGGALLALLVATMLAGDWLEELKQERKNLTRLKATGEGEEKGWRP